MFNPYRPSRAMCGTDLACRTLAGHLEPALCRLFPVRRIHPSCRRLRPAVPSAVAWAWTRRCWRGTRHRRWARRCRRQPMQRRCLRKPRRTGNSYRILDPAAFAKNTGLDWDTIVLQSTGGKPQDRVGFGVAANNDEERATLNDGIARGESATNIQRRIDALRTNGSKQDANSRQKTAHRLFSNQFPEDEVGAPIQIYDISRLQSPTQNGGRYNYVVTSEGKLTIGRRDNTRVGGRTY